ncbi:hypothetical protein Moror_520 [Moniliophthora roreri MCA 2997]|uniref:Wings apart-like protein C-terminal domain-containing protein n=2 Tax=Moniliophthora roreri TaxID=221103 RepID=V2WW89_MONRO|nr:hypothetical protein Moror_520 [Moniliophthora roreri MCA 2997]KAI3607622.1 hypothetical protein WG66_004756 [Moniliophthora roreri]
MSLRRTYSRRPAKRRAESEQQLDIQKKPKLDSELPSSPKLARDLSHIFDDAAASLASSSKPAPSSPTKVAKRMLGRSKTDSLINSEPNTPRTSRILDRTASLPSGFGTPSSSKPVPSHSLPASPAKPPPEIPASPKRAVSHKRTYAGKSRTFLVALPVDPSLTSLEQSVPTEDEYLNHESYTSLRTRWGIDNSEDDPYPIDAQDDQPNSAAGSPSKGKGKGRTTKGKLQEKPAVLPPDIVKPLKSITEIRNKGESRRFLDEVGYLLEGMEKDETSALRRTSALEIANRLCEADFARKAKAADFLMRTWEAFIEAGAGNGEDKIFDILFALFCALVSRDLSSLTDLVQRAQVPGSSKSAFPSPFVTNLFSLLSCWTPASDPLYAISQPFTTDTQLRKLGMMKNDRFLLQSIHTTIVSRSGLFSVHTNVSSLLLVTHTLSLIPSTYLSPTRHFKTLLQCMESSLQPLIIEPLDGPVNGKSHTNGYTQGSGQVPFAMIQGLLGMLDAYLLKQWYHENNEADLEEALDGAREEWLAAGLIGLGVHAEAACTGRKALELDDHDHVDVASANKCTELLFRVLVSLTHGDHDWSASFVRDPNALSFMIREICRADTARRSGSASGRNGVDKRRNKGKQPVKMEILDLTDTDDEDNDTKDGALDQSHPSSRYSATEALDRLCLALGLLTNLVQVVDSARDVMRETKIDPKCFQKAKPCITTCVCSNPTSILSILTDVYRSQIPQTHPKYKAEPRSPSEELASMKVEEAEADADASFLLGHISILFGLLMLDSRANQDIIVNALPSNSGSRWSKLDRMLDNAKALGTFYTAISRQMARDDREREADEEEEEDEEYQERNVNGREGRMSDAARGANIAQDVILFLERLRDTTR